MNRITLGLALLIVFETTIQSVDGAEFLFGEPKNIGAPINTNGIDHSHLSADGLSIYVTSGHGLGQPFGGGGRKSLSVIRRGSTSDPWGSREDLGPNVNGGGSVGIPSVTGDELSLFYSDTIAHWGPILRDGFGGGDLWVSTRPSVDSGWGEATNVGEAINTRYLEADASISANGLSLFFISNRPGGSGDVDIWTSNRVSLESPWQEPQNLGPLVNTPTAERTPSIAPDGLTLFYAHRPASEFPDLWATSRADVNSPWQEPVNLGPNINLSLADLSPQLSADGSNFYFSRVPNAVQCNCPTPNFDVFSVDVLPFESVSLVVGSGGYVQDFDQALGSDGRAKGTVLPTGWTVSDNETVFSRTTDLAFPVGRSLGSSGSNPILNAGAEGDSDRTLAIGAQDRLEGGMIQLLADVAGGDAKSVQLQFDIEAWDARNNSGTDDPGEAAFQVHIDIDRGSGYETLADLGTISTGVLDKATGDHLDGNAAKNRTSFDRQINGSIPAGSKLKVHWHVDRDAQTNNWVFGLDNVNLTLLDTIDAVDIDALSAEVRAGTNDPLFDLNGDGFVDDADRTAWVQDIAGTFFGDADLNKEVDFADFLALSDAFGGEGAWANGDFDGNGNVDFPDFLMLSSNFGKSATEVAAVPEPNAAMLLLVGLISLVRGKRKGFSCDAF